MRAHLPLYPVARGYLPAYQIGLSAFVLQAFHSLICTVRTRLPTSLPCRCHLHEHPAVGSCDLERAPRPHAAQLAHACVKESSTVLCTDIAPHRRGSAPCRALPLLLFLADRILRSFAELRLASQAAVRFAELRFASQASRRRGADARGGATALQRRGLAPQHIRMQV
eukprot:2005612-Pleurochrysis_carterae.AAC.1